MADDFEVNLPDRSGIDLPDVFPLEDVVVDSEEHIYRVYEGDQGPLPEEEYTLDKAPILDIREVTGTVDGSEHTFEKGTDYKLSADTERILWLNGDRPDAGTIFYVTYRTDSVIGRYTESADEELDQIQHNLEAAIESRLLSTAEGVELDRIGALFGPVIGKRRDRNDEQYRIYLESVVQSFVSRGTKTGIKLAISAATDVPIEDITINEDFENNEYEVIVIPDTPVDVALLEEISEIADPSGVNQIRTRFPVTDSMFVTDSASFTEGIQIGPEVAGIADSTASPRRNFIDDVAIDDTVDVPPKDAVTSDETVSDDTVQQPTEETIIWDDASWDEFDWATEHN